MMLLKLNVYLLTTDDGFRKAKYSLKIYLNLMKELFRNK
tara:strand:- start:546 stop:662 length:117 start_codon:yes stop_codon:yes gene_type:complete